jgi:hypothetical protein
LGALNEVKVCVGESSVNQISLVKNHVPKGLKPNPNQDKPIEIGNTYLHDKA